MKILVVCQYYYPEPFRVTDICEELVKRGHEITVLTGVPNYPEGIIYKGYEKNQNRHEVINGVDVERCWTIPRKKGPFYRLLNYYSYAFSASCKILLNKIKPKNANEFDVVLVNQLSPVMMAYPGIFYKKKHKKKLVMYSLDLWPESLVAGDISRKSIIYKFFNKVSRDIYRQCDKIFVTSRMFINYLSEEFKINKDKITYLPQFAEEIFETIKLKDKENKNIDLLFAGNIGVVQNLQVIINAADKLREFENIRFHIVGGGTDLERIRALAYKKHLKNVVFYGRQPLKKMKEYYSKADAMLISLNSDPILNMTVPGKLQSYLASGKPVIASINGDVATIISEAKCGFVGSSNSVDVLVDNIKRFASLNIEERAQMSKNARSYYKKNFDKQIFFDNFIGYLEENFWK